MKNIALCLLLIGFFSFHSNASDVKSSIQSVTVYLNGAEVSRTATVNLKPGIQEVKLKDLSGSLQKETINANFSGTDVKIISISSNIIFNAEMKEKIELTQDSIKQQEKKIAITKAAITNFSKEEQLLKANEARIGVGETVNATALESSADFYRKRYNEITEQKLEKEFLLKEQEKDLSELTKNLNQLYRKYNKRDTEITVQVASKTTQSSKIELTYLVQDAAWYPTYNIRGESIEKPITIEYNSKIKNNTGKDWEKVALTLSTNNPFKTLDIPVLDVWRLNFDEPRIYQGNYAKKYERSKSEMVHMEMESDMLMEEESAYEDSYEPTTVDISEVAVNFELSGKQNIPADGKTHFLEIKNYSLPANYKYYAIPKLDPDAFLLAYVHGWEDANLLPSDANIFYQNKYVGQTYLNPTTDDTLKISLGRDSKIIVERAKLKDFEGKKFIGFNKKESMAYEISVKNTRKEAITIEIRDQLPVSQNSDITVEDALYDGAVLEEGTGKLTWNYKVAPGEQKRMKFSFSIKYPKSKKLNPDRNRSVSAPAHFW